MQRWDAAAGLRPRSDWLAREEPLEIRVRGRSVAVTMRTPGHDEELAAGFLLTEGLIHRRADVVRIAHCRRGEAAQFRNTLNVFLPPSVEVDFDQLTRHVFASSSCGLCGKSSIESVHQHFAPVESAARIPAQVLLRLPQKLRAAQAAFAQTGGLHAAAVFETSGRLVVLREDVGRHNAVDKVLGFGLRRGRLPFDWHVLLVSGRASFEIMQKALAARVPIVAAVSAPSSLAVEFARESGQTLVGFLRDGSFNLYSHPQRIADAPAPRPRSRPRRAAANFRGRGRERGGVKISG
ncbi:MAG: formate dehydrogenase accessory sulfurtransferase FdhD [Verrucomicrobia bacterium]|nr:formate dehydrogenase accessory sulfurtransferase FdhD [Verrucomicrobiota bacterium]